METKNREQAVMEIVEKFQELADAPASTMTMRQRAAIELRIPKSGLDWLDHMIEERCERDERLAAATALIAAETIVPGYICRDLSGRVGLPEHTLVSAGFDPAEFWDSLFEDAGE